MSVLRKLWRPTPNNNKLKTADYMLATVSNHQRLKWKSGDIISHLTHKVNAQGHSQCAFSLSCIFASPSLAASEWSWPTCCIFPPPAPRQITPSQRAQQHIKCPVTHTFLGRNGAISPQTKVDAHWFGRAAPGSRGLWVCCRERRERPFGSAA